MLLRVLSLLPGRSATLSGLMRTLLVGNEDRSISTHTEMTQFGVLVVGRFESSSTHTDMNEFGSRVSRSQGTFELVQ